jgi:uncharacterized membrane protein
MTSTHNPFEPPKSDVADPQQPAPAVQLISNGQRLPIGAGVDWISEAFALFGKAPGIWIVITVIFFMGNFVLAFVPGIGGLASTLLGPVLVGGLMLGCRALEQGEALEINHLFAGFKEHVGPLVLIGALYLIGLIGVMLIVALIIILPAVLLIGVSLSDVTDLSGSMAPGVVLVILLAGLVAAAAIVPLVMAYWFAPPLVVFHNLPAVDALKQSFFGCLKNLLPFLLYGVLMLIAAALATLPLLLGWLVLLPVIFATIYTSYRGVFVKGA